MQMKPWSRLLVAFVALALLATACRGGDDDPADAESDPDPTPEESEPEDADDTEDTDDDVDAGDTEDDDGEAGVTTGVGVTEEPCPEAVNADNGCIYLGVMSDFTQGPFSAAGPLIQDAQEAFFRRVNEEGGIAGHDIDITTHVEDNHYDPQTQVQVFEEMRDDILAVGLSLGSSTTLAIIEDLQAENLVAVPAAWNSDFPFEDIIAESGANYCFESMNAVDFFVESNAEAGKVMAIHYPNDYGQDGSVGVRLAAEAHGLEYVHVPTPPGQDAQAEAIGRILSEEPDLVVLTVAPAETAAIVGQAAAGGFTGRFIGHSPTWNVALLDTAAGPALEGLYHQAAPWATFDSDTAGHNAMREYLGDVGGNDFYTAGWVWSYPILRALEAAADNGDLTREGVVDAFRNLTSVDYEGMLPEGAGNYAGDPAERAVRATVIGQPDPEGAAGITTVRDLFVGPTAEAYDFTEPCLDLYGQ